MSEVSFATLIRGSVLRNLVFLLLESMHINIFFTNSLLDSETMHFENGLTDPVNLILKEKNYYFLAENNGIYSPAFMSRDCRLSC